MYTTSNWEKFVRVQVLVTGACDSSEGDRSYLVGTERPRERTRRPTRRLAGLTLYLSVAQGNRRARSKRLFVTPGLLVASLKRVRCPTSVVINEKHTLRWLCRGDALQDLHVVGEVIAVEARIGQLHNRRLDTVGLENG